MIYKLYLVGRLESFATVKINANVRVGERIRFKDLIYKINDIDLLDLYVTL